MDSFYRYNFKAVFLGSEKDAFRQAWLLYFRYGIESVVLDRKISFFCRICPFIKTISTANIKEDDLILGFLDSIVQKNGNATHLLFVDRKKFGGFILRCENELERRFILHPETVLNDL